MKNIYRNSQVRFLLLNLESWKDKALVTWLSIITKYTYPRAIVKNVFFLSYKLYPLSWGSHPGKIPFLLSLPQTGFLFIFQGSCKKPPPPKFSLILSWRKSSFYALLQQPFASYLSIWLFLIDLRFSSNGNWQAFLPCHRASTADAETVAELFSVPHLTQRLSNHL